MRNDSGGSGALAKFLGNFICKKRVISGFEVAVDDYLAVECPWCVFPLMLGLFPLAPVVCFYLGLHMQYNRTVLCTVYSSVE